MERENCEGRNPGLVKLLIAWVEVARRREIRLIDPINPFIMTISDRKIQREMDSKKLQNTNDLRTVKTVRINDDSENQRP